MKIQLEQLDLLAPWPTFKLRDRSHAARVLVKIGDAPVGEVFARSVRTGLITPRRLSKRIARTLGYKLLGVLTQEAIAAGPEALAALSMHTPAPARLANLSAATPRVFPKLIERHLLLPTGLPSPWPDLLAEARLRRPRLTLPPVTVVVCTRGRAEHVEPCIASLLALDYPSFDVLIVDNSPTAEAADITRQICQRLGVNFIHEPSPGLSRARNTALAVVRNRWIAFTDDDCRPEPNWLTELVRKLQDTNCRCVTGLVLPAQLDNSAEVAFEIYGGLGRGYADVAYPALFRRENRFRPAATWNIGAGANMLIDADLARALGGFDVDLGAGSACPCSEDTLLWYQFLHRGRSIHYTPRAIVHHFHRSSADSLRKQIYAYAKGHAAYHVKCLIGYGDYRSLLHLVYHLPRWLIKNYRRAARGRTRYPRSLIPIEARGTVAGVLTCTGIVIRRLMGRIMGASNESNAGMATVEVYSAPGRAHVNESVNHDYVTDQQPARVA